MTGAVGRIGAVLAATAVALSVAALASLAPGSPLISSCAGAGSGHAALVVEHADGSVVTRCVSFGTATVTGQALLESSGVVWSGRTFGGYGVAVCALDAEPIHYTTCPGQDSYWAIFVSRGGGAWQLSSIGISSLTLGDGDAEGFRYVPASGTPTPQPPPSPVGVCATAAPSGTTVATSRPATVPATPVPSGAARAATSTTAPSAPTLPTGTASPLAIEGAATGASPAATAAPAAPIASAPSAAPRSGVTQGSGLDAGLLVAALAGGGLGGLALLRLAAARRRAT